MLPPLFFTVLALAASLFFGVTGVLVLVRSARAPRARGLLLAAGALLCLYAVWFAAVRILRLVYPPVLGAPGSARPARPPLHDLTYDVLQPSWYYANDLLVLGAAVLLLVALLRARTPDRAPRSGPAAQPSHPAGPHTGRPPRPADPHTGRSRGEPAHGEQYRSPRSQGPAPHGGPSWQPAAPGYGPSSAPLPRTGPARSGPDRGGPEHFGTPVSGPQSPPVPQAHQRNRDPQAPQGQQGTQGTQGQQGQQRSHTPRHRHTPVWSQAPGTPPGAPPGPRPLPEPSPGPPSAPPAGPPTGATAGPPHEPSPGPLPEPPPGPAPGTPAAPLHQYGPAWRPASRAPGRPTPAELSAPGGQQPPPVPQGQPDQPPPRRRPGRHRAPEPPE